MTKLTNITEGSLEAEVVLNCQLTAGEAKAAGGLRQVAATWEVDVWRVAEGLETCRVFWPEEAAAGSCVAQLVQCCCRGCCRVFWR